MPRPARHWACQFILRLRTVNVSLETMEVSHHQPTHSLTYKCHELQCLLELIENLIVRTLGRSSCSPVERWAVVAVFDFFVEFASRANKVTFRRFPGNLMTRS